MCGRGRASAAGPSARAGTVGADQAPLAVSRVIVGLGDGDGTETVDGLEEAHRAPYQRVALVGGPRQESRQALQILAISVGEAIAASLYSKHQFATAQSRELVHGQSSRELFKNLQ
jgi:hypothetical protein